MSRLSFNIGQTYVMENVLLSKATSRSRSIRSADNLLKPVENIQNCSDDELEVISFKINTSDKLSTDSTPIKNYKQSMLSSFINSSTDTIINSSSQLEEIFNKPKTKRGKKKKDEGSSAFEVISTAAKITESFNPKQQSRVEKTSLANSTETLPLKSPNSLQKLGLRYEELKVAVTKTRQAYSAHKVSTFFCPDVHFIHEFGSHLLKAEEAVQNLGNVLGTVLSLDKSGNAITLLPDFNSDPSSEICLSEVESEKRNDIHHGSLTPPASEAGNYDNTSSLEDSSLTRKRKLSLTDSTPIANSIDKVSTRKLRNVNTASPNKSSSLIPQKCVVKMPSPQKQPLNTNFVNNTDVKKVKELSNVNKSKENANSENVEEYEVSKIKDYIKKQGDFFYHVSWKGYESYDDTFEPADNLTGCDEELGTFFYQRFLERHKVTDNNEYKKLLIPSESRNKELLYSAFEKFVCSLPESSIENSLKVLLGAKSQPIKSKNELQGDLLKILGIVIPSSERYVKLYSLLIKNMNLLNASQVREKQQAELRAWERNINIICSDPSPLTVENNSDLALPPQDFVYINGYLAGPKLNIPNDPLVGCECFECGIGIKGCCADQMGSYFAYSKYGRLRVSLGTPIYECNKLCKCPPNCHNRIVQKGRQISLSIFRTSNGRGWGVKTLEPIKKDTFVTEYVGEVITSEEAERRGEKYDSEGCTYLFDLDYNKGDLNPYTVDAAKYGNVSHFINHSCDPNLVVYNVWVNCLDPDLPRLALFAVCDIKKGEEITFDYNSGSTRQVAASVAESIDKSGLSFPETPTKNKDPNFVFQSPRITPKKNNRGLIEGKTECHCGAPNCRKFFF